MAKPTATLPTKETMDFALCSTTGNHVTHAEVRYRRYLPRWEEHTVCKLVAQPVRDCLSHRAREE